MTPKLSELPPKIEEWNSLQISFPRLEPDSSERCPVPYERLWDYVAIESGDCGKANEKRLQFIRTAIVGDTSPYWIWRYTDSDGYDHYLCIGFNAAGQYIMGLTDTLELTPEQYILAEYYSMIIEA